MFWSVFAAATDAKPGTVSRQFSKKAEKKHINMKIKTLLLTLLLFVSNNLLSQEKEKKTTGWKIVSQKEKDSVIVNTDNTFFLLGTLNDYMGREWVSKGEVFDRYYQYEKPLMKFVDSIVKKEFKVVLIEKDNCFISNEMAKKMNSFYSENDLIDSLFTTREKKISFLLGAYYRYGEKVNDNIYKIQIANSHKHTEIQQILVSLGCKNIFYKRMQNIPIQNIIYFESNDLIKAYLKTIELEKEKLFDSLFLSLRATKLSKEEYLKEKNKRNQKIVEMFESN